MTTATKTCRAEDEAALEDGVEVEEEQQEEVVIYHGHTTRISNRITSLASYSR